MNSYDPHNLLVRRGFSYEGRSGYLSRWRRESDGIEVLVSWIDYDAWITRNGTFPSIMNLEGRLATEEGRAEVSAIFANL